MPIVSVLSQLAPRVEMAVRKAVGCLERGNFEMSSKDSLVIGAG